MTTKELNEYADEYLKERFGATTGNNYVRQALIDGYNLKLKFENLPDLLDKIDECIDYRLVEVGVDELFIDVIEKIKGIAEDNELFLVED